MKQLIDKKKKRNLLQPESQMLSKDYQGFYNKG